MVQSAIETLPSEAWNDPYSSNDAISRCLARAIQSLDDSLRAEFLGLFPGGVEEISAMDEVDIKRRINDAPMNYAKMMRYGRGSTALVVLQVGRDVWTANLGDCEAVIGFKPEGGSRWETEIISGGPHNGRTNPEEKAKVMADHPLELDVMKGDRVLGLIAVTRGELI